MEKKSVERKRFNYKFKAKCALILGLVLGLLLVCYGGVQLYGYHKERGNETVEELNDTYDDYAAEANKYNKEKNEEYAKNGVSDKYVELSEKWAEATQKASKAGQSIYMDKTGYHNPRNLWELITTVPLLFVGIVCMAAGFIARALILNNGKKEEIRKARESKK